MMPFTTSSKFVLGLSLASLGSVSAVLAAAARKSYATCHIVKAMEDAHSEYWDAPWDAPRYNNFNRALILDQAKEKLLQTIYSEDQLSKFLTDETEDALVHIPYQQAVAEANIITLNVLQRLRQRADAEKAAATEMLAADAAFKRVQSVAGKAISKAISKARSSSNVLVSEGDVASAEKRLSDAAQAL